MTSAKFHQILIGILVFLGTITGAWAIIANQLTTAGVSQHGTDVAQAIVGFAMVAIGAITHAIWGDKFDSPPVPPAA